MPALSSPQEFNSPARLLQLVSDSGQTLEEFHGTAGNPKPGSVVFWGRRSQAVLVVVNTYRVIILHLFEMRLALCCTQYYSADILVVWK